MACVAALGSCKEQPTTDQVQVADVNGRNALARVSDLSDRVEQLEADNSDLEDRLDRQDGENSRLQAELDSLRSEIDLLNTR